MYFVAVVLFLFICPVTSVAIEAGIFHQPFWNLGLIGRWWVFWAVGLRLFIAGIRQAVQPRFTAEEIFEIHDPLALPIVREVGFGNLSTGVLGILSMLQRGWAIPAAIVGGLYYGFAAVVHVSQKEKTPNACIAMISDACASLILLAFVLASLGVIRT